jgi:hypothetical protein
MAASKNVKKIASATLAPNHRRDGGCYHCGAQAC